MLSRCRSVPTRLGVAAALVMAMSASTIPAAAAGPPQGGGGCHMVASPTLTGLSHMMAGSANGAGSANMAAMLRRFSPDPFCGF
jgi:hypothetical protein